MKKLLLVLFVLVLSGSCFATPAWNRPFGKPAFSDPYVTNWNVSVIGTQGYPNYALLVQANFDQSVPVPYYVTISVPGVWYGIGSGYKIFNLLYATNQWRKSITYKMDGTEEAYTEVAEMTDYGPQ